jgi:hypothetical protein
MDIVTSVGAELIWIWFLCDVTCRWVVCFRSFEGPSCVHLQQSIKMFEQSSFLGLLAEDEGTMVLPNEADSYSALQEISCKLRNFTLFKCSTYVSLLCQVKPLYPIHIRSILILYRHPCLGLSRGSFPLGFPTKTLYKFLVQTASWHASCTPPEYPTSYTFLVFSVYNRRRQRLFAVDTGWSRG